MRKGTRDQHGALLKSTRSRCPHSSLQGEQHLATCHKLPYLRPLSSLSQQLPHLWLHETSHRRYRLRTASTSRSVGLHDLVPAVFLQIPHEHTHMHMRAHTHTVRAHTHTHTYTHTHTVAGCDLPRMDTAFRDDAIIDPYVCISLIETSENSPLSAVSAPFLQTQCQMPEALDEPLFDCVLNIHRTTCA